VEKETIIKAAFKSRESGDYSIIMNFFSDDAVIEGYVYGNQKASDFFKVLFQDTFSLKLNILEINQDKINPNVAIVRFDFLWKLKKEQILTGTVTEICHFNSDNKIKHISATGNVKNIENSQMGMIREMIIEKGINNINAGNYPAVIDLFDEEAILECIYGYLKPVSCLKIFLNDTAHSKIIIHKVTQDPTNYNNVIANLEFIWTLKDGQTITGHMLQTFVFNSKNKIAYVATKYSFAGLS